MAALSVTVAQAQLAHEKIGEFEGGLVTPVGVAVNDTTGHIYVGNYESGVVEFNEAGTAEHTITEGKVLFANGRKGVAVDKDLSSPSAGDLYVTDPGNHVVDKFTSTGVFICQLNTEGEAGCPSNTLAPAAFASPEGVAVNPSNGNVYVDDAGNNVIEVFSPSGVYLNEITASNALPLQSSIAVAVDSHGTVYATTEGVAGATYATVKFAPSSETVTGTTTWTETEWEAVNLTTAIATDAEDHVYVGNFNGGNEPVTERTATGELVSTFASEVVVGDGLAVNNTTHNIYDAETGSNRVFIYNTVIEPTVVTGAASEVAHTSAKVEGTINPEGLTIANCFFEYGPEGETPQTQACNLSGAEIGTGNAPVTVEAALTGLTAGKHYLYKLVVESEGNVVHGGELSFDTPALISGTTEAATAITAKSATLHGKIAAPEGGHYYFEYGSSAVTENKTTELPVAASLEETPVEAAVAGLTPGVTYHFRLVVIAESNPPSPCNELEFTTELAAPTVLEESTANLESQSAQLKGEINPEGGETHYLFEYEEAAKFAETGIYERRTSREGPTAAGANPFRVSASVSELHPGTVYSYRLTVEGSGGTTHGADGTFKTKDPRLPSAIPLPNGGKEVEVTSPMSATLRFQIELNGLPATYTLETGSEVDAQGRPIYSTPTFGAVPEDGALSFSLTNLLPSTVYHVRVVVRNADGTFTGEDHTFTTPGFPTVILIPPPVQIIPTPPQPKPPPPVPPKTRAEKYHHAVALCHKKPKKKRAACLRKAKKRYGPVKKKGKK